MSNEKPTLLNAKPEQTCVVNIVGEAKLAIDIQHKQITSHKKAERGQIKVISIGLQFLKNIKSDTCLLLDSSFIRPFIAAVSIV